jgi:hypothetical protein
LIDLVLKEDNHWIAIQIFERESIYDRDLYLLRNFAKKLREALYLGN